jgi:tetratricopeptide (TPR) repeat protein
MNTLKLICSIFLLFFIMASPVFGKDLSWQELNDKVTGYYQQQQYSTAVGYAEEALALARKSGTKEEIATSLKNLGEISTHMGRQTEAEAYNKESIAIRQKLFGPDGLEVALSWRSLGFTYFLSEKMDDAEMCFEEVLRIQVKNYGEKSIEIVPALQRLEKFYKYTKNNDKEKAMTERILSLQTGPE